MQSDKLLFEFWEILLNFQRIRIAIIKVQIGFGKI